MRDTMLAWKMLTQAQAGRSRGRQSWGAASLLGL